MRGEVWMEIRNDRQKGLSYTEIARKYHIDPRTAKKYAESETKPVYNLSNPKPSKLDPYKEQIRLWLECQCQSKNVGKRRRNFACF